MEYAKAEMKKPAKKMGKKRKMKKGKKGSKEKLIKKLKKQQGVNNPFALANSIMKKG